MKGPVEGAADPLATFERVLARYATGAGGSLSDAPTELDYGTAARDPSTGEIAPRPGAPQRGGEQHLRALTYALLGALTATRQLRDQLVGAEERAARAEERLACVERAVGLQGERLERAELEGAYLVRLGLLLALGLGGAAGLASLAMGLAGGLWWSL